MLSKAELEIKLSHSLKVTTDHGGNKMTHEVRNDEANERDREAAKNRGD